MRTLREFPFEKARRVTAREVEEARKAIELMTGVKRGRRPGRPPKKVQEKYVPVSIRLHPRALAWLKREAKKRGVAYQSLLNEILLKQPA
jgi:uncharacterized protein (DUF4415 family)